MLGKTGTGQFSAAELRDAFSYDPETGRIVRLWIPTRWGGKRAGAEGGRLRYDGYRTFRYVGTFLSGHILAWVLHYGVWPVGKVDHIDGDTSNTRINNLRECSHAENTRNRKPNAGKKLKGICLKGARWHAQIRLPNSKQQTWLGSYSTPEAGARAYDAAAKKAFGEFARLNYVD